MKTALLPTQIEFLNRIDAWDEALEPIVRAAFGVRNAAAPNSLFNLDEAMEALISAVDEVAQ